MTVQVTAKNLTEPAGGRTVFIVDDDVDMIHSLESLLQSLGYLVEAYATAQSFLDRVEAGISGCVLLDVRLPAISGLEVQRRLSEAHRAIPIIFLTGHGDIQMAVSAMKAGAVEFLPKPFREQQLIEAVAEAMDRFERDEEDVRARNAYQLDITYLSPKERAILDDLSSGFQIKEIATRHTLSASTIRVHRRNIKSKIKIETLSQFLILHNKYGKKF
jgi:two-component system, LuxR family, response regulator FixJ